MGEMIKREMKNNCIEFSLPQPAIYLKFSFASKLSGFMCFQFKFFNFLKNIYNNFIYFYLPATFFKPLFLALAFLTKTIFA